MSVAPGQILCEIVAVSCDFVAQLSFCLTAISHERYQPGNDKGGDIQVGKEHLVEAVGHLQVKSVNGMIYVRRMSAV